MVEIKRVVGSPLGVLVAKLQKVRAFAGCWHKDHNPKSGAPKVPKGIDIGGDDDLGNETQTLSLEEAEAREGLYFDLAVEPKSRGSSLGSSGEDHSASINTKVAGLGDPGDTGRWYINPRPECSGGTAYLYTLYQQGPGTINNDSAPTYLYPNAVTIGTVITLNKNNTLTGTFNRRSRRMVQGVFVEESDGDLQLRVGNWESAPIDISINTPSIAFQSSPNFYTTLGVEVDGKGLGIASNGKARSTVVQVFPNISLTSEHCGGLHDSFRFKTLGNWERKFLPTHYKPESGIDTPSVVFNHFSYVPLVGHYVDLTQPAWVGKYTTATSVTGPGFMELVLGQWRVISFTVPYNLTPISNTGGVSGEY